MNCSIILGELAQRAIRGNGALWQKPRTSSVFSPDPPQRAISRNGILWSGARGKPRFWSFPGSYGALWYESLFSTPALTVAAATSPSPRAAGKQFQKMDCAAPASFTHTHDIPGLHPPFSPQRVARGDPPSEGIGGGPKERGSLASSYRATPLRPPIVIRDFFA
jgi:hypothetical protein